MLIDNNIIISRERKNSGKITVKVEEPAVLLRANGLTTLTNTKLRLIRKSKNGNTSFSELDITPVYQKIKVHPYESVEVEIPDWRKLNIETDFHFKLITGTHNELLFKELDETVFNYNIQSDRKNFTFIIGNPIGSYIAVQRVFRDYTCRIRVNNRDYLLNNECMIKGDSCLEKLFLNIHSNIESMKERFNLNDSPRHLINEKDVNFNKMLNRHFKPAVY